MSEFLIRLTILIIGLSLGAIIGLIVGREVRDAELADKNHDRGGELW